PALAVFAPPTEAPAYEPAVEERLDKSYTAEESSGAGAELQNSASVDRLVIKQASISVAVADAAKAMTSVSKLAEATGGYVVDSNVWNNSSYDGTKYTQSSITIRIPAEKLEEVLAEIRALAADPENGVISESVNGQDVTSDYVDSQSQLRNLEAAEKQLVELLDSATDLEYTLDIFRELTNIRSQIEVLKGHIQYLEESSAMSSVSAEFVAETSIQPIQIGPWKPAGVAKEALQALIKAAQTLGTGLIWFVITWLPFLIPLGLIVYFIVKGARKRRAARKAQADAGTHGSLPTTKV
ncbi:MAG: DUF4349 domain-containing protein, partial [Anaerolineaceae bacterium]